MAVGPDEPRRGSAASANGLPGHGSPVPRWTRSTLPPREPRSRGLVPTAASPVPTQQGAVRCVEQQPAPAVATAGRREAGQHPSADRPVPRALSRQASRGRRARAGEPAVAGVEPPGARSRRSTARDIRPVSPEPHTVRRGTGHGAPLPLAHDAEPAPVPLGDQEPTAAELLDVPRDVQAADHPTYVEPGAPPRRPRGRRWPDHRRATRRREVTAIRPPAARGPSKKRGAWADASANWHPATINPGGSEGVLGTRGRCRP